MSRVWGLPVLSSDALSSVAYAVEEILMALVPALGFAATRYVGLVSIPILGLLVVLVISYSQIIKNYPNGGGSYIVSKANFGPGAALLRSCLPDGRLHYDGRRFDPHHPRRPLFRHFRLWADITCLSRSEASR